MSDAGILLEQTPPANVFSNNGRYKIIEGASVIEGEYDVFTRPADQLNHVLKWESFVEVIPDEEETNFDGKNLPPPKTEWGNGFLILWEFAKDPHGVDAKRVHNKIVELAQRGIPAIQILEEMREEILVHQRQLNQIQLNSPPHARL